MASLNIASPEARSAIISKLSAERMRVGIAVITYNRVETLINCLKSIISFTSIGSDISCAVFDDGTDADLSSLLSPYSIGGPVFQSKSNCGVVFNKNRALYYFTEIEPVDIIVLLEDDVCVEAPGWINEWIDAAVRYGHMNYSPIWFRDGFHKKFWISSADCKGTVSDPYLYSAVTGQCTSLRTELIRDGVGYLNPRFQGYGYGHVEWTCRFLAKGHGGIFEKEGQRAFYAINGGVGVQPSKTYKNPEELNQNATVYSDLMNLPQYELVSKPWLDGQEALFKEIYKVLN